MVKYETAPCSSESLQDYVLNYFQVSAEQPGESLLVPSGKQYIIFHLLGTAEYRHKKKKVVFQNETLLIYVHHEFYSLHSSENFLAFGVALNPNGIFQFFGKRFTKESFFLSRTEELQDQEALQQLCQQLRQLETIVERVVLVEKFLCSKLNSFRRGELVSRFLEVTGAVDFAGTTKEIASLLYTNQRTLELKFCSITGTTPGKYIRLKRFVRLFADYSSGLYSISDLILKYNYTDYSHLSRAFVKHTGKSLGATQKNRNSLYYSLLAAGAVPGSQI